MTASEMVARSKQGQHSSQFSLPCAHIYLGYIHVNLPPQMKICFEGLGRGPPEYLQQFFARVSLDHLYSALCPKADTGGVHA